MDIKEVMKMAHENAVDKGFYDCGECIGDGKEGIYGKCHKCNGTGIDPNKNIGELLMLIVSELGEALEAHRNNRFANKEAFSDIIKLIEGNSKLGLVAHYPQIKDTFEDEIADVFIRLFDLCGYLGIEPVLPTTAIMPEIKNMGESILFITRTIVDTNYSELSLLSAISDSVQLLEYFCSDLNIPIKKHIAAKMEYNKTRPHKHGKSY